MRRVLLLATHGNPPNDFPAEELAEFMRLHSRAEHGPGTPPETADRLAQLERRLRSWPRTSENDPFHAASLALGSALEAASGSPVVVAFNEFCAPDIGEGLERAARLTPEQIIVVTPMLTPGGQHAERDIPAAIAEAQRRHPEIRFVYAWPIPLDATAALLAEQVEHASFPEA